VFDAPDHRKEAEVCAVLALVCVSLYVVSVMHHSNPLLKLIFVSSIGPVKSELGLHLLSPF